ncbi:class C sortase [Bifidobacterium biavatii]|uniref:Sortase-like protein n=1 Tax=Bifidobacterium biavatii DSM 23969 TaxID=1437608 RepID=A0A087A4M9_9BIFI|nr:class C sortase [Bifidobacterium biavatii]KFI53729.1 sortase-like protein [Bifidobacterium biavatii DSM 23969]
MKGRVRRIVPLVVIAVGLLVLFYPTISNFLIMKNASRVVGNYDSQVNSLTDEQYQQMIDAAHAYNKRLAEQNAGATDALSGAVNTPSNDKEYNSLLNLSGDGMMGYLTVPRLKETMPIYHGTSEEVLQSGIGHLEQTSLPVGGDTTHAALSGHRGLPTAKLFTDLNLMKTGDKFYIKILKDTYAYQVDKITTVLPTDTKELVIEKGKDQVTLITCTPYAVNTHRLLVRAHRIPYTPEDEQDAKPTFHVDIPLQYALPSIALILFLIGWRIWRRRDEKRRRVDTAEQVVNSVLGLNGGATSAAVAAGKSAASTASAKAEANDSGAIVAANDTIAPSSAPTSTGNDAASSSQSSASASSSTTSSATPTRKGPAKHGRHA